MRSTARLRPVSWVAASAAHAPGSRCYVKCGPGKARGPPTHMPQRGHSHSLPTETRRSCASHASPSNSPTQPATPWPCCDNIPHTSASDHDVRLLRLAFHPRIHEHLSRLRQPAHIMHCMGVGFTTWQGRAQAAAAAVDEGSVCGKNSHRCDARQCDRIPRRSPRQRACLGGTCPPPSCSVSRWRRPSSVSGTASAGLVRSDSYMG